MLLTLKALREYIFEDSNKPGTYAGMKFSSSINHALHNFCLTNNIPNPVPVNKLHVTLLYSRKHLPNYKAANYLVNPIICHPKELVVWETNGENKPKTRCLILKLTSPELVERHNHLMKTHDATFDYPVYEPHVTLSYDIGSMDITHLIVNPTAKLPLVHEYSEDLRTDWAATLNA